MADATSFTLPSPGLSATLLSKRDQYLVSYTMETDEVPQLFNMPRVYTLLRNSIVKCIFPLDNIVVNIMIFASKDSY